MQQMATSMALSGWAWISSLNAAIIEHSDKGLQADVRSRPPQTPAVSCHVPLAFRLSKSVIASKS